MVDPNGIDQNLHARIRIVGDQLGVGDRTALGYAPDDVANSVASEIIGAVRALTARRASGEPEAVPAASRGHLGVVQ